MPPSGARVMQLFEFGWRSNELYLESISLLGQDPGTRSPHRMVRGSMVEVRFVGTKRIELSRCSEVNF